MASYTYTLWRLSHVSPDRCEAEVIKFTNSRKEAENADLATWFDKSDLKRDTSINADWLQPINF